MKHLPKISVVTPNFNQGSTLEETILSVLEQRYPNLEYIMVDGGSTDESIDIIQKYSGQFSKIIIESDRGMYDALTKGFKHTTGDILAWLNSDDLYEPNALLRVGAHFADNPKSDLVYFTDTVLKDGWRVPNRPQKYISTQHLIHGHILYQDGCFFRRDAYTQAGGINHNLKLAGDYELWLKLSMGSTIDMLPGHASCFRVRNGQLSGNWGDYLDEVNLIKNGFLKSLTVPDKVNIFFKGKVCQIKNLLSRKQAPAKLWQLENEGLPWANVIEPAAKPISENTCPVCGSPPDRLLFSTPDTRFGGREIYRIYQCDRCDSAFIFPKPNTEVLDHLYETTYSAKSQVIDDGDLSNGLYSPYRRDGVIDNRFFRLLGKLFQPLHRALKIPYDDIVSLSKLPKSSKILEVGCFEGRVLEYYKHLGYGQLSGTEINTVAASKAEEKGFKIYRLDIAQCSLSAIDQRFDAIILNQALEHFPDPLLALRQIGQFLTPKGEIYISVPNLESYWLQKKYGPTWAHWHVPFHFVTFRPASLKYLSSKAGFDVKWMRSSTPIHWAYLSEQLCKRGLGGFASHNIVTLNSRLWSAAKGVAVFSWLLLDRRLQGDCLYACFKKRE